jgi:hypothetical protein
LPSLENCDREIPKQSCLKAQLKLCDANNTVLLNTFNNDVPLNVLESLIQFARERLEPFEDGSPLPKAEPM